MIDGFEESDGDGAALIRILVCRKVTESLNAWDRDRRSYVRKIGSILRRLRTFGETKLVNTEQFRMEGRHGQGNIAAYAIKAYQLLVYGGFLNLGGVREFVCIEGAVKKKNRPDRTQLKRVAKKIVEFNARN